MGLSRYLEAMFTIRKSNRGSVFILGILVTVFLFLFGALLLLSVRRDLQFESRRQLQARAHYLALSGVEHYQGTVIPPNLAQLGPIQLGPGEMFAVNGTSDGTIESRGYLVSPQGTILAEETLVVPHGLPARRYKKP